MDDVLECTPASWDFSEHDKHPVLLPNHNSRANPIGIVKNKRVEAGCCAVGFILRAPGRPLFRMSAERLYRKAY